MSLSALTQKLNISLDHGPEATKYLREFIGEHYHYSEKPVFKALWESYNNCQFVEDTGTCYIHYHRTMIYRLLEGDILFYRDKKGRARVQPAT